MARPRPLSVRLPEAGLPYEFKTASQFWSVLIADGGNAVAAFTDDGVWVGYHPENPVAVGETISRMRGVDAVAVITDDTIHRLANGRKIR